MRSILIVSSGNKLGTVVSSGHIEYNIFRRYVGESWTAYCSENRTIGLDDFIDFHNDRSHIQIEAVQTELITLD
jgi:hypothetical protein